MNIIEENNEEDLDESNHSFGLLNRSLILKQQNSQKSIVEQKPTITSVKSENLKFDDKENLNNLNITKPNLKNLFANDLKDLTNIIVNKNKSFVNLNFNQKETNSSIRPTSKDSNIPKFNNSL